MSRLWPVARHDAVFQPDPIVSPALGAGPRGRVVAPQDRTAPIGPPQAPLVCLRRRSGPSAKADQRSLWWADRRGPVLGGDNTPARACAEGRRDNRIRLKYSVMARHRPQSRHFATRRVGGRNARAADRWARREPSRRLRPRRPGPSRWPGCRGYPVAAKVAG